MKTQDLREHLIQTASDLPAFSEKSYKEYEEKIPEMVNRLNDIMLKRPDIEILTGSSANIEMMKDNHNNHAIFIASILKNFNKNVLVDTILWVFRAYRSRHFHTNYWAAQLNAWRNIILSTLTKETTENIMPLYNWMQTNIPAFTELSDDKIVESKSKNLSN